MGLLKSKILSVPSDYEVKVTILVAAFDRRDALDLVKSMMQELEEKYPWILGWDVGEE